MTTPDLFSPYDLGPVTLSNRIVMAPLTRNRAGPGFVPGDLAVEYYRQRATAGLIIAEATQISQQGQGYQDTPGIYSPAQVEGWRRVTDAVHAEGGRIVLQLWHVGRISHVDLQPGGAAPVAPSAIRAETKTFVNDGFVDVSEPRALTLEELPDIVDDFRRAAANAIAAGFDGVEIHGANGYLLDQFAKDGANARTDAYGGSVENRARLMPIAPGSGFRLPRRPTESRPAIRNPSSTISSIALVRSASSTSTWSKARPEGRATIRSSTTVRCAAGSRTPTSPTTATTARSPRPDSSRARPTCSPSVAPSSPIPTWWNG
jgi:hypothetical protein